MRECMVAANERGSVVAGGGSPHQETLRLLMQRIVFQSPTGRGPSFMDHSQGKRHAAIAEKDSVMPVAESFALALGPACIGELR